MAMTPREIEQAVFDLEQVRIAIQAPTKTPMGDFDFKRKAAGTASITEWLQQRISPLVGEFGVTVVDGTGAIPHGRTKMETLRDSYSR